MSYGPNSETKEWIRTARNVDPLSLGPILGQYGIALDIPNTLIASSLGVSEQTVLRWITGRAEIPPRTSAQVAKLIAFFNWMRGEKHAPLVGNVKQKEQQLAVAMTTFLASARGLQKTTVRA